MRQVLFLFGLAFFASACALVDLDEPLFTEDNPPIETDRGRYEAVLDGLRPPAYRVDIPLTYVNRTGRTVFMIGCHPPLPPSLQKQVGGDWVAVYTEVAKLCQSPALPVRPGGVLRDTLRVMAFAPGRNATPVLEQELEGRFRLVMGIHADRGGDAPLPLEQRVSNVFDIVTRAD